MIALFASTLYFFVMSVYYWNKVRKLNDKASEQYDSITKYKIMLSGYAETIRNLDRDNKALKDQNRGLKAGLAGDFQFESSMNRYMDKG